MPFEDAKETVSAPILAVDLGSKRVGVAVSDSLSISIKRLQAIPRSNWKQLLQDVLDLIQRFDAKTVVIGLPLQLNGLAGDAALGARETAEKFARSLKIPVYLQDERLTSVEAEENLRAAGLQSVEIRNAVDSEAAAIILRDFLETTEARVPVRADLSD